MLERLKIKNIALIDNADINFNKGLNVLSGETGAGKSVIIDSLNFVLGAKADKTLIRNGESECLVTAEFSLYNDLLKDVFLEFDIDYEDSLIITRKFSIDGKSSIKLNGNTVTVSMLKRFTQKLVDVHGQSEHFYLLNESNQLNLIDDFGGDCVSHIKEKLLIEFKNYKEVLSKIDSLGGDEESRKIRIDVLNYQINEIEKAEILEGEEQDLKDKKQLFFNQEKIISTLSSVKDAYFSEGGISDIFSNAKRELNSISNLSEEYSNLNSRLIDGYSEISDIFESVSDILDNFEDNHLDIDYISNRLDLIKDLKRKYGDSVSKVYEYLENAKNELENLENFNEIASKLLDEKLNIQQKLYNLYGQLHNERLKSANNFSNSVLTEIKKLGMPKADFKVDFVDIPSFDECKFNSVNGIDDVKFLFSANFGEPVKPMGAIISGGEISRFMLAVKAVTAKISKVETFIFDEIDAGISGNTAKTVAEKFNDISKSNQIIAISHLPQISAMADNNLLIKKIENDVKTITLVKNLSDEEKVLEIVRLVGGGADSELAKSHAKDLISQANAYKNK